jgi:hypothetical protein
MSKNLLKYKLAFCAFLLCPALSVNAQNAGAPAQTAKQQVAQKGVLNDRALDLPQPDYPNDADNPEKVKVQVTVNEHGDVIAASVVSGPAELRKISIAAAKKATFEPATLEGKPVKSQGVIDYNLEAANYKIQMGVFLLAMRLDGPDDYDYDPNADDEVFISKELFVRFPDLKDILKPIYSEQPSVEDQKLVFDEVKIKVKNLFTDSDLWQFSVGEQLGNVSRELYRHSEDSTYISDQSKIKKSLGILKDLISIAPADFPPQILHKMKKLLRHANEEDLVDKMEIFSLDILEIFQTISPGEFDGC